jgi:hypothetical protein
MWSLAAPGRRRLRPCWRQGDSLELGVGTERHSAPGHDLTPAHEALPETWFLGGVQDPGVGIEAGGHHRGDAFGEGSETLGDPRRMCGPRTRGTPSP